MPESARRGFPRRIFAGKLTGRNLTGQLFLYIILPTTLLLLAVAILSTSLHQQAMHKMVGQRDEWMTSALASTIASRIEQGSLQVSVLADQYALSGSLPSLDAANVLDGGIAIVEQGQLTTVGGESTIWQQAAVQDYLAEVGAVPSGETPAPRIVEIGSGEGFVFFAAPVNDTPVYLVGALDASLVLQDTGRVGMLIASQTGEVLLSRGMDEVVEKNLWQPGVESAGSVSSGVHYAGDRSGEFVIAYSTIPHTDWVLVTAEKWEDISNPLLRTTQFAPLVLAPMIVIAVMVIGFGLQQIIRPLQKLEKETENISTGNYHAIEDPVGGISEIQHLQDTLVSLTQKIQEYQSSLHTYIGKITTGQEEERRRIARELHDVTLQSIIALNQRVQLLQRAPESCQQPEKLKELQIMIEKTIKELRRTTAALRPTYLEELGLSTALDMLVRDTQKTTSIHLSFSMFGKERRLPDEVELAYYRIAQEGLSNILRHAAAGTAGLNLKFATDWVRLSIQDDGVGFRPPADPAQYARNGHFGLIGMYERAELIGAGLSVQSSPRGGTQINLQWQLHVSDN